MYSISRRRNGTRNPRAEKYLMLVEGFVQGLLGQTTIHPTICELL